MKILLILLIILVIMILIPMAIFLFNFIENRFYFHKFYHNDMERFKELFEITCGEIKENKILFSLTDRYVNLKNRLDNMKSFDEMVGFLREFKSLNNDKSNMFYEKIKYLNNDEKEECIKCHIKYLKMFDDYEKKY